MPTSFLLFNIFCATLRLSLGRLRENALAPRQDLDLFFPKISGGNARDLHFLRVAALVEHSPRPQKKAVFMHYTVEATWRIWLHTRNITVICAVLVNMQRCYYRLLILCWICSFSSDDNVPYRCLIGVIAQTINNLFEAVMSRENELFQELNHLRCQFLLKVQLR